MAAIDPARPNVDTPRGFAFALAAYLIWGALPFYMRAVGHIPPMEVVAHRIVWSLPIAGLTLLFNRQLADIARVFRTPKMLGMGFVTAAFVSVNWLIYVYAIGSGHAVDAALGYYINPLISVCVGAVLLGERLTRAQAAAIGLAAVAVAILTWEAGGLPWISLGLAVTWAFYAYFKKALPIGPNEGFFLEVLILTPLSLAYIFWREGLGLGHFVDTGMHDTLLLMAAGVVTAIPLMIYANGAKLLRLSTIGLMQYLTPTIVFLIAIFIFREPFNMTKLIAFGFIWTALAIYSWSAIRAVRKG